MNDLMDLLLHWKTRKWYWLTHKWYWITPIIVVMTLFLLIFILSNPTLK